VCLGDRSEPAGDGARCMRLGQVRDVESDGLWRAGKRGELMPAAPGVEVLPVRAERLEGGWGLGGLDEGPRFADEVLEAGGLGKQRDSVLLHGGNSFCRAQERAVLRKGTKRTQVVIEGGSRTAGSEARRLQARPNTDPGREMEGVSGGAVRLAAEGG